MLRADHVPGTTISVVRGGETVFSKGYGVSDIATDAAFNPATSLVRIASISKLFVWTAVMQQVQAGRINLHENVNHYLTTFQIPHTYPQPITVLDLMDHTAGFEDRTIGTAGHRPQDVPPLGSYLAHHIPARIRPPGEVSAYSNYGAALAGYIVAQVSGEPYDQYVQQHILDPLAMRHTTAFEPVPTSIRATAAASYDYEDGVNQRVPFTFDKLGPDGSISATADDMARFLSAQLQDGRLDGARILDTGTAELMHQRSFSADPRIDGYAHGFKEKTVNGHRAIMHDGSWEGFLSLLELVPDEDLGIFISVNSTSGEDAETDILNGFFDRFAPTAASSARPSTSAVSADGGAGPETSAAADTAESAGARSTLTGFYQEARHNESSIEKVLSLTSQARLRFDGQGRLVFLNKTWAPAGPRLYQQVGGTERVAFTHDSGTYLITDGPTYERVPWSDTLTFNLAVLLLIGLAALTTVLGLASAALLRRIRGRPSSVSPAWQRARRLAGISATLGLVFLVLFVMILIGGAGSFLYAVPVSFQVLLLLPLISVAGTLAATVATVTAWRQAPAGVLGRGRQLFALAGLFALTWFCGHWNLLGWQFG